jgi:hypothetical protein
MALLPVNLDYTDKDFDALLDRLKKLTASVFPTWTDEQTANFGNILRELFAFVGDVLTTYQDNQAHESQIASARLRKNLLALVKLIGYAPAGASAATVDETFTLAAATSGTVTLPAGTKVLTAEVTDPIKYQLLEDLVFASGETQKTATIENSEFQTTSHTSSGLADQEVTLSAPGYVDGSASVTDAISSAWSAVDNFLDSTANSEHFVVVVDENERARVRFGNGINGKIPTGEVTIDYKTGGGSAGRVEQNKLTRLEGSFADSYGAPVVISVTNAAESSGGDDRETTEQIRQNGPASLRVLERAVAREDYEIVARQVAGVARALHLTKNEGLGVGENEGVLFVVPTGGGAPSVALLADVEAQFAAGGPYPKTNTYQLAIAAASYLTIDIQASVYRRAGSSAATVKANILAALDAFFAVQNDDGTDNEAIDFGYGYQDEEGEPTNEIPWSDVFNAIRDAAGVRKVDEGPTGLLLNGLRSDVSIASYEFPILGTVELLDASTGDPL